MERGEYAPPGADSSKTKLTGSLVRRSLSRLPECVPVIDHKEMIGMISIGDLVKAIIHEQQFVIEQLEHYIAS
jgi:hypothetical protein